MRALHYSIVGCVCIMMGVHFFSCTPLLATHDTGNVVIPQEIERKHELPEKRTGFIERENPYEGSLWRANNSRTFLYADSKARNINDIVTIKIVEQADASRNATTKLTRKGGMKSALSKFFGSPLDFGMENLWGKKTGVSTAAERVDQPFSPDLDTTTQNSFDGAGSTVRQDSLVATISARVVDVFPNGNMMIEGQREVTINEEKQYIYLSGVIRPEDVSPENVVSSTAIADAKISISGKGVITDKQSPGFGHKVFDKVWPF